MAWTLSVLVLTSISFPGHLVHLRTASICVDNNDEIGIGL